MKTLGLIVFSLLMGALMATATVANAGDRRYGGRHDVHYGGGHHHKSGGSRTLETIGKVAVVGAVGYGIYRLVNDNRPQPTEVTRVVYVTEERSPPPQCRDRQVTGRDIRGFPQTVYVIECWDPNRYAWIPQ